MADSIEKVYARALMEIAQENNSAEKLDSELDAICGICAANPELTRAMSAPTITDEEKLSLLSDIFKGRISETVFNFLCVLTENNRFGRLSSIAAQFRSDYYLTAGIAEVSVTSAVPLKEDARKKLTDKLAKMYDRKIILREKTDPSILGGMIVKYNGSCMDGSVKSSLERMKKQITQMQINAAD